MGNAVTAKKNAVKNKTYSISGDTLEAIYNDMLKKQIGGTDAVGDCTTGVSTPNIGRFDEEEDKKFKKQGMVQWFVTAKSGEVEMDATITLPELKSDKALSDDAKKEWARFLKELTAHEGLHVDAAWKVAEDIADELSTLKGTGAGKDKDAAVNAAQTDFVKQYKTAYGGTRVAERVKKAHEALDKKGNVFTLDIDIE
jgi:predicted secreted Zn-dependent protease